MANFNDIFSSRDYIEGFTRITVGQRKGLLFVESPNDVGFWRSLIENEYPNCYEIKVASKIKANGKRTLESEYLNLHENYIVGVDSDMDYLCPLRSSFAEELNGNKFILHTFSYSKESLQCSLESISDIMDRLVFHDSISNQMLEALNEVSHTIYDALTVHLFRHNLNAEEHPDGLLWTKLKAPKNVTLLNVVNLTINSSFLNGLRGKLTDFIDSFKVLDNEVHDFNNYVAELKMKGLTPDTAYQFIKGHVLHDEYVYPMLKMYRDKLFNIEKKKIGCECRAENKRGERDVRNGEIENFYNRTNVLETLLNNTLNYLQSPIYEKIKTKSRLVKT